MWSGGKNLNDCEIKIETPKLDFGDMEKEDVVLSLVRVVILW